MHKLMYPIAVFLLTLSFGNLNAQRVAEFPDRANDPRRAKALLVKKYDLFNAKKFKGFFFLEANYGLVGTFNRDETFTVSAPVSLGVGYRFSSNISIGLRAGQSVYNSEMYYFDRTFETRTQTKFRMLTANLNAHLPLGLRGEVYGGFGVGYQHTTINPLEPSQKPEEEDRRVVRPARGLFGTAQIGARYALSPQLSAQVEISSGLSNFNVGLRYRIR
ncbi:MAG: outer membrane beta-barrel protein [Bacteroidota bacterium]